MANPFDHFGTFLFAVYDHLFTMLAGCAITVLLDYAVKHIPFIKGKLTWKHDLLIVMGFVFFACFQAWHDEFKRADTLMHPAPPPAITVNVAPTPPSPVIFQPAQPNEGPNKIGASFDESDDGTLEDGKRFMFAVLTFRNVAGPARSLYSYGMYLKSGNKTNALHTLPLAPQVHAAGGPDGPKTYFREDYCEFKVQPIPSGGVSTCWLLQEYDPKLNSEPFDGKTILGVRFHDAISGKPSTVEFSLPRKNTPAAGQQ
jgi:hypothetical protein